MDPIFKPLTDEEKVYRKINKQYLRDNGDGTYDYLGDLDLSRLHFKSLESLPKIRVVHGSFHCHHNDLAALHGGPMETTDDYDCSYNRLETLAGGPDSVGRSFDCSYNQIKSLEGGPKWVGVNYDCTDNPIETLKGMPKYIGRYLILYNCPIDDIEWKKLKSEIRKYAGVVMGGILAGPYKFIWDYVNKTIIY